jgi:hypothetical protein
LLLGKSKGKRRHLLIIAFSKEEKQGPKGGKARAQRRKSKGNAREKGVIFFKYLVTTE